MAARRPFWKWHRWKSIGFCLWPPSTCIWNLKLKFQSKLDLCSGNHVVYRQTDGQTDGRTDKVNPVYPPSNFVGRGYNDSLQGYMNPGVVRLPVQSLKKDNEEQSQSLSASSSSSSSWFSSSPSVSLSSPSSRSSSKCHSRPQRSL